MKSVYVVIYRSRDMEMSEIEASFDKEGLRRFIKNLEKAPYCATLSDIIEVHVDNSLDLETIENRLDAYYNMYKTIPNSI
ncbi:MAG: hypothetical protein IKM20_03010 [Erysipelotrichales bacterium]|nr:hypothetical protein [Erysipelotrichales bacterium]